MTETRRSGRHIGKPSLILYFGTASWMVSMVVVWVSAALFLFWNIARTEDQVRASARAIASTVAMTVGPDLSYQSAQQVAPVVHRAADQKYVAWIRVRLNNGRILASAGNPAVPESTIWMESVPIVNFSVELGQVEVAIFRDASEAQVGEWVQPTLGMSVIATLLSALAALAVAYREARPIRMIQQTAVRWEEPLAYPVDQMDAPRELVQLGAAIMEMRSRALAKKAELENLVDLRTHELADAYAALEASFRETAAALAQALDARDRYTAFHAIRTANLVERIVARMNLSPEECRTFVLAASLHDIGKIGVPEHILLKPGPLSKDEWIVMRNHSVIGATILQPVHGMEEVATLVRHHHERWDGNGYPDRLKGKDIPLGSRILTIADTLETMCSRRSYREPVPPETALTEIQRCSGSQFDPEVVTVAWEELKQAAVAWSLGQLSAVAQERWNPHEQSPPDGLYEIGEPALTTGRKRE